MDGVTLYHNPRCSKSRQALALLQDRGMEIEVVEYLRHPPPVAELRRLCAALALEPLQLIRHKEKRFGELGLSVKDRRPVAEWLRVIHENPILMERPVAVRGKRAVLGRPPENVLALLQK